MQARRTRTYSSTLYILHTFHRVAYNSIEGVRRVQFSSTTPQRSTPPRRSIITPPFTPAISCLTAPDPYTRLPNRPANSRQPGPRVSLAASSRPANVRKRPQYLHAAAEGRHRTHLPEVLPEPSPPLPLIAHPAAVTPPLRWIWAKVRELEVRGDELGIKEPSAAKVGIEEVGPTKVDTIQMHLPTAVQSSPFSKLLVKMQA